MGISERCRGIHLLNHFRQTNIPINLNYVHIRDYENLEGHILINEDQRDIFSRNKNSWACTLSIRDSPTYVCFNSNKRDSLKVLLENIDARSYL